MSVFEKTLELLKSRPDYADILRRAVEYEKEHHRDEHFQDLGWEWNQVRCDPVKLHRLFLKEVLNQPYKSTNHKGYLLADREAVERALALYEDPTLLEEEGVEVPGDLFSIIYGHEDIKRAFMMSLTGEMPTHILLVGDVSSAKSLFMSELAGLRGAAFILGGLSTKVGIRDIIADGAKYIIIDELDKVESGKELSALLSYMESGVMAIAKHGVHRIMKGKSWIFGACNTTRALPPELLSRFVVLNIPAYTEEELRGVIVKVLTEREGKSKKMAEYIAERVIEDLRSRDPRDAVKIARASKNKRDVNELVRIMRKYRSTPSFFG